MSCDTYFSLQNLEGSSMETEVGWSTLCIPNKIKLAIFVVLLILQVISLMGYIYFAAAEFKRQSSWSWRKNLFCLTILGGIAETILLILFVSGVQSPGRYILVPISGTCAGITSTFSFRTFTRVFADITKDVEIDQRAKKTIRVYNIANMLTLALQFFFYGVLPIIVSHSKLAVNASLTVACTLNSLTSAAFSFTFAMVYGQVAKQLHTSPDMPLSEEIAAVRKKVLRLNRVGLAFGFFALMTCLFPLWLILTTINGDNGLQGFFYFFFCYMTLQVIIGTNFIVYSAVKSKGKTGTSSGHSQDEKSVKEKKNSKEVSESGNTQKEPSNFAIEELTGR